MTSSLLGAGRRRDAPYILVVERVQSSLGLGGWAGGEGARPVARGGVVRDALMRRRGMAGPPSPPVPVMHSPTRKVSVKDQQAWKIPPCISNWKNAKGCVPPRSPPPPMPYDSTEA